MWTITFRDLAYRWRQFLIAVIGTGLAFALALDLTGMSQGFRTEARATVASIGTDTWLVPAGVSGPFTSFSVLPAASADTVGATPGVKRAAPLVISPMTVSMGGRTRGIGMIGYRPGDIGAPQVTHGRTAERTGEAVVDRSLGLRIGDQAVLAGRPLVVVGTVTGKTYFAGVPLVFVPLADAQAVAFGGQPLATVIVARGAPEQAVPGLRVLSNDDVRRDLLRPMANPTKSIDNTRLFMWAVAALIVGAVTYLSVLERLRDFAVLKAVGARFWSLMATVSLQAVVASLLAATVALVLANVLRPAYEVPIDITPGAYLALPAVAIAVGLLSSGAGLRRALRVDPALAFAS